MDPGQDAVTEYRKMLVATQQTFDMALNERNYKGGGFKNLINANTPPIDTLDILLASHLVTENEKTTAFRPWRNALISLQNKDIASVGIWGVISEFAGAMEWTDVFDKDLQARGEYVPPLMVQQVRDNGTVSQTSTWVNDEAVKTTEGGVLFEVPGAPVDFNAAQAKYAAELGLEKMWAASDAQVAESQQPPSEPVAATGNDESSLTEQAAEAGAAGNAAKSAGQEGRFAGGVGEILDEGETKGAAEEDDKEKRFGQGDNKGSGLGNETDGDFDAAFSRNIRGAFL